MLESVVIAQQYGSDNRRPVTFLSSFVMKDDNVQNRQASNAIATHVNENVPKSVWSQFCILGVSDGACNFFLPGSAI